MTDDERDGTQRPQRDGSSSSGSSPEKSQSEGAPSPSESDEKIAGMEQRIERVDDRIEDAKEEADKATELDPQPFTGTQGEQQNSTDS
ncbi:MAG: hypothetical protein QOD46_1364 [Actinomycetota bacterium]|jgi:hypothetical protein|nr:hypothetical protein [Actinomycetota bacterium]